MPDKIYNWRHLEVACIYGCFFVNGTRYRVDKSDPRKPLVRYQISMKEAGVKDENAT